jgi:hypothetical protein
MQLGVNDKMKIISRNPVLLFIGSTSNKNLQNLIPALHGLKVHLRIIGDLKLRVKVKEANEQPTQQRYSLESAGKIGYVYPALKKGPNDFAFVKLEEGDNDETSFGGEYHKDALILIENMYPLSYGNPTEEFEKFMHRHDYELGNFRKDNDMPPEGFFGDIDSRYK